MKASDFKATIVRDFRLNSPGIGFFRNIIGADSCEASPTLCKDISGIKIDDSAGTVEIDLKQPQSDFLYAPRCRWTSRSSSSRASRRRSRWPRSTLSPNP